MGLLYLIFLCFVLIIGGVWASTLFNDCEPIKGIIVVFISIILFIVIIFLPHDDSPEIATKYIRSTSWENISFTKEVKISWVEKTYKWWSWESFTNTGKNFIEVTDIKVEE
jgi:hypothetical protein